MSDRNDTQQADKGALQSAMEQLSRTVEVFRGSRIDVENWAPGRHGRLVDFAGREGYEEVDRYWLNAPFSYASINYDAEENKYLYHVVEPSLDAFEAELLDALYEDVRNPLLYGEEAEDDEGAERVLMEELRDRLEEYGVDVDMPGFYRLFYYLWRRFRGFGKIDALMHDPNIEDISCDGYGLPLYAYHENYQDVETNVSYGEDELDSFVIQLAQQSGRHISVGNPVVETTLEDGSRAELALGQEVTPRARRSPSGSTARSRSRPSTCSGSGPTVWTRWPTSGWPSSTTRTSSSPAGRRRERPPR